MKRVILLVLDGLGVGAQPDAAAFGESRCNTLGNLAGYRKNLCIPNLQKLGIGNIIPLDGVIAADNPFAYGKMTELSAGNDTTVGHWEMMGIITGSALPVFPNGFPQEVIESFTERIGRPILHNKPASGTEIINLLGDEHIMTGAPIVYTSADSVFQIAAHEDSVPVETLYEYCRTAREILRGDYGVGRVIARPFAGKPGAYYRTERRRDFSINPPSGGWLEILFNYGIINVSVGKVAEIFAHNFFTAEIAAKTNKDVSAAIIDAMDCPDFSKDGSKIFIFANFSDFDSLYGHRNDSEGYALAMEAFDIWLPQLLDRLNDNDILIITADHGNDPTTKSTDHNREFAPVLVCGSRVKNNTNLGVRRTFADIGATIADFFSVEQSAAGKSFWPDIRLSVNR